MELFSFLKLPDAQAITDLDSPQTCIVHKRIIQSKPFLKKLYTDFYLDFKKRVAPYGSNACVVEIGSGAGFIKDILPGVKTSDVFFAPWLDVLCTVNHMPFADESVDAFLLLNVFHHLPNIIESLGEMNRCLRKGGKIIMIEPANTAWHRLVAKSFQHESFALDAGWGIEGEGRLSAGNGALPWIVFERDRAMFQKAFPGLLIKEIRLHSPFRYLCSGGLSYRAFLPQWMYPVIVRIEQALFPLNPFLAFFQTIELEKV